MPPRGHGRRNDKFTYNAKCQQCRPQMRESQTFEGEWAKVDGSWGVIGCVEPEVDVKWRSGESNLGRRSAENMGQCRCKTRRETAR
jgi:hypothetical protein